MMPKNNMILILGSSGMVGQALLKELGGLKVFAPSREELDLQNPADIADYLRVTNVETVIHLAGHLGGLSARLRSPTKYYLSNIQMAHNLFSACAESKVEHVLNIGTSLLYSNDKSKVHEEDYILSGSCCPGKDPYVNAKYAAVRYAQYVNFEREYPLIKTLIPCNLFGPYDRFSPKVSQMIPGIIHRIHQAKKANLPFVEAFGHPDMERETLYVNDFSKALVSAVRNFDEISEVMNLASGYRMSVKDYYRKIAQVVGFRGEIIFDEDQKNGSPAQSGILIGRKFEKFGWKPQFSFETAIEATYKYYLNSYNGGLNEC